MRLSSLGPRILASAVATSLVAVGMLWFAGSQAIHRVTSEMDRANVTERDVGLCQVAPALWSKELGGFLAVHAYDARTGISANPAAPPLDLGLAARATVPDVPAGDTRVDHLSVVRMGEQGPCSLFQTRIRPPPTAAILAHAGFIVTGGIGAMFAVAGLTLLLAVRPIVARIRRVREAAGGVGQGHYRSAGDGTGDEIAHISRVLDESHARIQADRAELLARHAALERHLAEIAHDLRTPLASLLLTTEALSEAPADDAAALASQALEDTVYLDALVDNLRQATLLRHGLDPGASEGRSDLGDITRRVGQRFAALGRRRGVEVEHAVPDLPVLVRCPPALAERALANLAHNAVIHGRTGGHVAVVLEARGDRFCLRVLDDGPGVPPEVLSDLERRTFRDDPVRPRDQGLGLAITNEICRRAGWDIRYGRGAEGGLEVAVEGPLEGAIRGGT